MAGKIRTRTYSMKSLSFAVGGREAAYPVYDFRRSSGEAFVERPGHNPFKGG